jgi:hypothetical protein
MSTKTDKIIPTFRIQRMNVCLCLSQSVSVCLCPSLSVSLSLFYFLTPSISIASLSLSLSLSLSVTVPSLTPFLFLALILAFFNLCIGLFRKQSVGLFLSACQLQKCFDLIENENVVIKFSLTPPNLK